VAPSEIPAQHPQPQAAGTPPAASAELAAPAPAVAEAPARPPAPVPAPLTSPDGRLTITADAVKVRGQSFLLLELERAELTPVRWLLWYLLGGLGLAGVMIAFLQNWLHTLPAMAGMAATALLLLYGRRGTNRLRLYRLGREMVNFALPGDTAAWQRLTAEAMRQAAAAAAEIQSFDDPSSLPTSSV
jgi:hypothetical protein